MSEIFITQYLSWIFKKECIHKNNFNNMVICKLVTEITFIHKYSWSYCFLGMLLKFEVLEWFKVTKIYCPPTKKKPLYIWFLYFVFKLVAWKNHWLTYILFNLVANSYCKIFCQLIAEQILVLNVSFVRESTAEDLYGVV